MIKVTENICKSLFICQNQNNLRIKIPQNVCQTNFEDLANNNFIQQNYQPFYNMDKTQNRFRTDQKIGLFTFYQMQQKKQYPTQQNLSKVNSENKHIKPTARPKILLVNQNKDQGHKHRVHSVVNCQTEVDEDQTTRCLGRKINLKLNDKRYSQVFGQQKQSIVDLAFDFSSSRRKNTLIKPFQSQSPQHTKKINHICLFSPKQSEIQPQPYSIHLKKISQIKRESTGEDLQSNKDLQKPSKKRRLTSKTQIQQPKVDQLQLIEPQIYKSHVIRKQSCFINKLKTDKLQPLNIIQHFEKKRKRIVQDYKKMRQNKKIEILQLKVSDNPIFGLRKIPLKDLSWLT